MNTVQQKYTDADECEIPFKMFNTVCKEQHTEVNGACIALNRITDLEKMVDVKY